MLARTVRAVVRKSTIKNLASCMLLVWVFKSKANALDKNKCMKNYIILICSLLALPNCGDTPPGQQKSEGDKRFHTTQPSALYFKNMRSTQYKMKEQPKSRIELYQHKKLAENTPVLPVIAHNWLQDEAYLFLQPNPNAAELAQPLQFTTDTTAAEETIKLAPPTPAQQYETALRLYKGLKAEKGWFIRQQNGNFQPLYREGNERAAFLTTVRDYLKLTEAR